MRTGQLCIGSQTGKAWLLSTTILAGISLLGISTAHAAGAPKNSPAEIQAIYDLLAKQEAMIKEQQRQIDTLKAQINVATSPVARPAPMPAVLREPVAPDQRGPQTETGEAKIYKVGATEPAAAGQSPVGAAPEQTRPEIAALVEEGGVLTRKGQLILEPSLEYIRSDTNRAEVAGFSVLPGIVIGNIEISQAARNTLVSALTARYGVTNRLEVEAKIPYVYREDTTTTRPLGVGAGADTVTGATGSDLGDIEVAAHYQINDGLRNWPFLIGNLRLKTITGNDPFEVARDPTGIELDLPTGTGFYSLEPSITALLPSDPAVLFANLSYNWNIERDVGGAFGKIDPGDSIGASFGMGVSLNERLSLSLSYDHTMVVKSTRDGESLPGSSTLQIGRFTWGTSYRVSDDVSINANVAMGVTNDAPDMDFLLRVPIKVDLFGG